MARRKHQIHDHAFKALFGAREAALPLLASVLPRELVDAIDPGSLVSEPTGIVNDALDEDIRDLVFSARVRGRHTLFCLLEHQRRVDRMMPFRLLRYVVNIWDAWRRRHPRAKKLPGVICVVLHQGRRAWSGPTSLAELIDLPKDVGDAVRPYVPELKVALLDLGTQDARALARDFPGPPHVRLALSFLRSAVEPKARLAPTIAAAATEVRHLLARPGGAAWWRLLLRYTVLARPGLDVRAVEAELRRHAGTQAGEVMKSTYEELIEQGERRGLRKGREEGRAGLLSLQLEARFGKLSAVIARRVRDASTAELERWAKRVLTAKRIEDVIPPQRARKR